MKMPRDPLLVRTPKTGTVNSMIAFLMTAVFGMTFQGLHACTRQRGQINHGNARSGWRIFFGLEERARKDDFLAIARPCGTRIVHPPARTIAVRRIRQGSGRTRS